jgi:hypothetical protein
MTDRIPADVNPYQTPASLSLGDSTSADELDDPRLARRLTRLAAVMIDWVFVELGVGSGMLTNLALGLVFDHPVGLLVGVGGMLAVEAWLIATRGQSIGKVLFRIRVVSDAHGRTLWPTEEMPARLRCRHAGGVGRSAGPGVRRAAVS